MTTTITLRPMTDGEFQRLRAATFEDYAREIANVNSISMEEGRQAAAHQFDSLLPDGMASKGHYFSRAERMLPLQASVRHVKNSQRLHVSMPRMCSMRLL